MKTFAVNKIQLKVYVLLKEINHSKQKAIGFDGNIFIVKVRF